jgi:Protein of unknown function (DUF1800)
LGAPLIFIYRQLGQLPFYPPNVKGWDGGKSWINTATLAYRYELARELVNGVLPEQVGLPKAPAKPTPSPSPAKQLAASAQTRHRQCAVTETDCHGDRATGSYTSFSIDWGIVNERQRTSANVSERQRTSANVSERQRTSKNVKERQRTSTNVSERQRTPANVKERQQTALSFTVVH